MALQDDLNRLQKQLGNFLFPRKCPFCGAVTGGRLLCSSCERTLPYTGENALCQGTFGRLRLAAVLYRPRPGGYPPLQVSGPHRRAGLLRPSAGRLRRPVVFRRV